MVFSGSKEEKRTMAMGPERSNLHNFALPCSWGTQRYLRCMKVAPDDNGDHRSPPPASTRRRESESDARDSSSSEKKRARITKGVRIRGDDDGIDAVREKLMLDLKTEADRMKDAIFRKEVSEEEKEVSARAVGREAAAVAAEARPWNLRTRRSACKGPLAGTGDGGKGLKIEEKPPMRTFNGAAVKSTKSRSSPPPEKVNFSLALSKEEIEEDFIKLMGHRPPRRPKKRSRNVQRHLDTIFPGLWLPEEVTADSYKVPEAPENAKR